MFPNNPQFPNETPAEPTPQPVAQPVPEVPPQPQTFAPQTFPVTPPISTSPTPPLKKKSLRPRLLLFGGIVLILILVAVVVFIMKPFSSNTVTADGTNLAATFDPDKPIPYEKNGKTTGDGQWGYISTKGKVLIEPQYEISSEFCGNYAVVLKVNSKNQSEYAVIDKAGNVKLKSNDIIEQNSACFMVANEVLYGSNMQKLSSDDMTVKLTSNEHWAYTKKDTKGKETEIGLLDPSGKNVYSCSAEECYDIDLAHINLGFKDKYVVIKPRSSADNQNFQIINLDTKKVVYESKEKISVDEAYYDDNVFVVGDLSDGGKIIFIQNDVVVWEGKGNYIDDSGWVQANCLYKNYIIYDKKDSAGNGAYDIDTKKGLDISDCKVSSFDDPLVINNGSVRNLYYLWRADGYKIDTGKIYEKYKEYIASSGGDIDVYSLPTGTFRQIQKEKGQSLVLVQLNSSVSSTKMINHYSALLDTNTMEEVFSVDENVNYTGGHDSPIFTAEVPQEETEVDGVQYRAKVVAHNMLTGKKLEFENAVTTNNHRMIAADERSNYMVVTVEDPKTEQKTLDYYNLDFEKIFSVKQVK